MKLQRSYITDSPNKKGRVRLVGEVTYDDPTVKPESYWFEFPGQYAEYLSTSGNPWLACLLPAAVVLGEPLQICSPVDRVLLENVNELMHIWKCWFPRLPVVPIEAEVSDALVHEAGPRVATFFSGGVDSFFTVLNYDTYADTRIHAPIDDLLWISGLDVPLTRAKAIAWIRCEMQKAASDLGKGFIDIATNIRETRTFDLREWPRYRHCCGLGSIALALEKRYKRVLVASAHGYKNLQPWGNHPLTDPLLSTGRMEIVHHGAGFDRVEKTEFISKSDVAMRWLRPCTKSLTGPNCCACFKCYTTMVTLALLGALDKAPAFRPGTFSMRKTARIYSHDENGEYGSFNTRFFLREMQDHALRRKKFAIARAIERSFKYSSRLDEWLPIMRSLQTKPFFWRLGRLERALLVDSVN